MHISRRSRNQRWTRIIIRLPFFTSLVIISCALLLLRTMTSKNFLMHTDSPADEVIQKWLKITPEEVNELINLDQNDLRLAEFVKKKFIIAPPDERRAKNVTITNDPSKGQAKRIANLLNNKTGGTFLECGAVDGYFSSNTLYLEDALGWSGVLVEPDPDNLAKLLAFKRHAWVAATCLSTEPSPVHSSFKRHQGAQNRVWQMPLYRDDSSTQDILCVPINSLLNALNMRHIDYVSFDVEGFELDLLKTFPFNKVSVNVFSIAFSLIAEGQYALMDFMEENGYEPIESTELEQQPNHWAEEDMIFIKKKAAIDA